MAGKLHAWVGPLIQQECEQVTAWCYGTGDNINSLGHGPYIRSPSEIETIFKDPKILQIDRFDSTIRHIIEARLSDSATFIHAVFDKASIINHRKQTGNSFKVGTEGGFIELELYTLCLIVSPGKPRRAIIKVHDFTYLGQVGASTVGQPTPMEEQQKLCACLDQLGSVLSSTGYSKSPSPVYSQVGDSHTESQALAISTQYLPSAELNPQTSKPPSRAPTTDDLMSLLGSKARKPLKALDEKPPLESARTEVQASLQQILKNLVPTKKNGVSPAENNTVLPTAAKSKQTMISHEPPPVSITPDAPASDGEKETSQKSRPTNKQIAISIVCDESTNGDEEVGNQPQVEKEPQDCPWEELGRIPQRDMNIPKDQLKFLNQDSAWIRSANDLKSSSSHVPPTTLQEVDQFIDHQALHELVQSSKKPDTAAITLETQSRLASMVERSDSEDDIVGTWSSSPDRGVERAIDLPNKEANFDYKDDLLVESEDGDNMSVQYAEEVLRFRELSPQIYSPPYEHHSTNPVAEPCEEPMNNVRPITSNKQSVSSTSDIDDETDEDDMELEVPHAIDDVDADIPDILSSSPSIDGDARTAVQVERTPRTRTSAVHISSQDNNFNARKTNSTEAVSSSVELIPGTLESEVFRSNKGSLTSLHSLDGFNDLEQMDDENMLDNQLESESGLDLLSNAADEISMSRPDAQSAHLSKKSERITRKAPERASPAMSEATSSHSPKNTPSKSSRLDSKKRRIVKEIDFEFSQASQEEVNPKDLANANRRKFMARENNSRFTDTGESVPEIHQEPSQQATRPSVPADQVQQPAFATSAVSTAVTNTPSRHVSFDQPGDILQPSPARKTSSMPGDQTPEIVQDTESSLEKPHNELDLSTEETIFGKYIAVYPSYEGSLRAFVRCAAYLKWLKETKSDPHRSLYDDIIRVFASIEYSEHIKEMKAKNEQPQPLLAFYNETVDTPIYNERIVLPLDLPEILKLDHVEAARSARAFTERKSRSMNVSRATSVGSVRIPAHEYVSGSQMTGITPDHESVQPRQRFFETESQLQPNTQPHSPTPPLSATANKEVNEVTHEDTELLFMSDDYDDIDMRPGSTKSSKKRKLFWNSSSRDDVVSPPTALPVFPSMRKENWSVASSSRFVEPKTTESRKSPVLGANLTPRSSLQNPRASRPVSTLSAVRSKISSRSSLTPAAANKPKPNPSRRYTMAPLNKSLEEEFGDRRVAKRPRHSMPARVSYERIEPATPAEVELVRLAREFVPKRTSLDAGYAAGSPFSSASSRRRSARQSLRHGEPETQDWGI